MANPKGYYTSRYSGEEIDMLLSGIPPGGAADKSVQNTVEAIRVPSRTVEVAATDLPAYIEGLPRLLTENLTVRVTGSAAIPRLTCIGFYGSGLLYIQVTEGSEVKVYVQVFIDYCSVPITLEGLRIIGDNSGAGTIFAVVRTPLVVARDCVIDRGRDIGKSGSVAQTGSRLLLERCQITHCSPAINCISGSITCAINCTGVNNTVGVSTTGGLVMLTGTTPELMGGTTNQKNGGLIVKSNGTLL